VAGLSLAPVPAGPGDQRELALELRDVVAIGPRARALTAAVQHHEERSGARHVVDELGAVFAVAVLRAGVAGAPAAGRDVPAAAGAAGAVAG
jgi:hypothetical protein